MAYDDPFNRAGSSKKHRTVYDTPNNRDEGTETYAAAIEQQAGDYDEIMDRYRKLADGGGSSPERDALIRQYKTNAGRNTRYQRGPEYTAAFRNLNELARTGGYSQQGIADLRARGVSPIRSIYANAQSNLSRNRALSGGYSPSYNASATKMAREMSEQIGQRVTDVNAGIAQNVASNRLSAAPQYANYADSETRMINDINSRNAANRDTNLTGLERVYQGGQNQKMAGVEGMRHLYGTTPALSSLYGQQAATNFQLQPPPKRNRPGGFSFGGRM